MQNAAPTETSESDAGAADSSRSIREMIPLTQSKMHAVPAPPPEHPVLLPRRSALVIEILAFVLIAFLVVSALLFNLTAQRPQAATSSTVSMPLPPKLGEPAAAPSTGAVAPEKTQSASQEVLASSATLSEVQPQAGVASEPTVEPEAAAQPEPLAGIAALPLAAPVDTDGISQPAPPPAAVATLPPAAAPVVQDVPANVESEAAPPPTPAPAAETASLPLPSEETRALIRRGDQLLGTGDIVAARAAYERAAAGGDRTAAMGVAKTYDPIFLAQTGVRGLRGDPARAALWYGKAAAAGDPDAQQRLRRLRAQYPQ